MEKHYKYCSLLDAKYLIFLLVFWSGWRAKLFSVILETQDGECIMRLRCERKGRREKEKSGGRARVNKNPLDNS